MSQDGVASGGGRRAGAVRFLRDMARETPRSTMAAALVFVVLALVLALAPVPYVAWSPGTTVDVLGPGAEEDSRALEVEGVETYPTQGELRLTTVAVTRADAHLTLPAALLAHWLPGRDALPREAIYPEGVTQEESTTRSARMMSTSQQSAIVAGLRAGGVEIEDVTMVIGLTDGAPADGVLELGDTVLAIDGQEVTAPRQAVELIQDRQVGESARLRVQRGDQALDLEVGTEESPQEPGTPIIGATISVGYEHPGDVVFGIDPDIGGPSAGLVFALGIYDAITPGALTGDHVVAGTGTIETDGTLGSIGGINSKIRGASKADADVFLLPVDNCRHLDGDESTVQGMRLVPVATLAEAIAALEAIDEAGDPTHAHLPTCPTQEVDHP